MSARRWSRPRDEQGALALELAMLAPMFIFLLGLIWAYGIVGQVHGLLDAGTRDAARTATDARSYDQAQSNAQTVLDQALAQAPKSCRDSAKVHVHQEDFVPGNTVQTDATCTYTLADAGLPFVPVTIHADSTFLSPLDPNRGIAGGN